MVPHVKMGASCYISQSEPNACRRFAHTEAKLRRDGAKYIACRAPQPLRRERQATVGRVRELQHFPTYRQASTKFEHLMTPALLHNNTLIKLKYSLH